MLNAMQRRLANSSFKDPWNYNTNHEQEQEEEEEGKTIQKTRAY